MKRVIVLAALAGCSEPETAARPVYESSREITAVVTVKNVDLERRRVTLEGPQGNEIVCGVSQDVENLPQLAAGDRVAVTYVESTAVEILRKDGEERGVPVVEREREDGTFAREETMTARVVALDRSRGSVTLEDDDGDLTTVAVRRPERLSELRVGDRLRVTYRESVALRVQPQPKEAK
jgi:hypothetical protein